MNYAQRPAAPAGDASVFDLFPFRLSGWHKGLLWLGTWTFFGLLQAARLYFVYYGAEGEQLISWPQALTWALADGYIWGVMSFAVVWVTWHTPFERNTWLRDVLVHLLAAVTLGALQLLIYGLVYRPLGTWFEHQVGSSSEWAFPDMYEGLLRGKLHGAVLTYLLIAFLAFTLRFAARFREAERRRQQLETRLVRARLDALKMQLHPHFLFNTLNAITALIHSDPDAADRMTARLAELLRVTLDKEDRQEVPLRAELEFLEGYLDIQRMRFGSRLTVSLDIAADALDACVPNLILQPLVENAVQHGVAPHPGPGRVRVGAARRADRLVLEVSDDGPGLDGAPDEAGPGGLGLANTRDRLQQLYGDDHTFLLRNGTPHGLQITIDIPFNLKPGPQAR